MIALASFIAANDIVAESTGCNSTWIGTVKPLGVGQPIPVALKALDRKQLANEIIGYLMAKRMKLPVPTAYLTVVPSDEQAAMGAVQAPATLSKQLNTSGHVLFASAWSGLPFTCHYSTIHPEFFDALPDEGLDQTIQDALIALQAMNDQQFHQMIVNFRHIYEVIAFDTWAANGDRHIGNLLIDADDQVYIIDHSHLLTGNAWKNADLAQPDRQCGNLLYEAAQEKGIRGVDRHSQTASQQLAQNPLNQPVPLTTWIGEILGLETLSDLLHDTERQAVLRFLPERLTHLESLTNAMIAHYGAKP